MIRMLFAAAALLGAVPCAAQTHIDAAAFSAEMAARISRTTGREFAVVSPLTIRVKGTKPEDHTLFLDRIFQFCAHNTAEDCEISKANFAESMVEGFAEPPRITADLLRIVVRSSDYCAKIPTLPHMKRSGPLRRPF